MCTHTEIFPPIFFPRLPVWLCICMCMCRGVWGVCMFVWPCGWQDVAKLCFCHDYAWWNKASGSQMESLCMGAFVAFPGPSTAEILITKHFFQEKKKKTQIKNKILLDWNHWMIGNNLMLCWLYILQACLSAFGTFPLKRGDRGFHQRKPCYDNGTKQQWWLRGVTMCAISVVKLQFQTQA